MPFNKKNLKALVSLKLSDSDIAFTLKDEANGKAVEVKKESNINRTLELFLKPFDYLFNAEYITPQQRAQLRQMAVDEGDYCTFNASSTSNNRTAKRYVFLVSKQFSPFADADYEPSVL